MAVTNCLEDKNVVNKLRSACARWQTTIIWEKLAKVFEVSISEFFRSNDINENVNLPLLEKIKLIDTLGKEEQQALLKMIDLAIANKRMKDNLKHLIEE